MDVVQLLPPSDDCSDHLNKFAEYQQIALLVTEVPILNSHLNKVIVSTAQLRIELLLCT